MFMNKTKNKRKRRNFALPLLTFQNVALWKFRSHIQPFNQINSQLIFKHLVFYNIMFNFKNCFVSSTCLKYEELPFNVLALFGQTGPNKPTSYDISS